MIFDRIKRELAAAFGALRRPNAPLFFMHIPKNAGTSLIYHLANRFPADASLLYADRPESQAHDPNQFQFISGHVGLEYLKRFQRRPIMVTFLRDPLDRILSRYFFTQSFTTEGIHEELKNIAAPNRARQLHVMEQVRRLSLRDFVREEPELAQRFFANEQLRFLTGFAPGRPPDLVSLACDNLARCEVVGLTERFDESVDLLCHELGWEPFAKTAPQNVTRQRIKVADLDDETKEAVVKFLEPDIAIYEFAKQLFEKRWQAITNSNATSRERSREFVLPDSADYTLDRPIIGAGWYPREKCDGTWSSWSGSEAESWLDLRRPAGTIRHFRCELFHPVAPQVLQSLQVRINDHLITLRQRKSGRKFLLEGKVPAEAIEANREKLRVSFYVNNRWRPCDLDPTSKDDRWLGINVSRLSLTRAA